MKKMQANSTASDAAFTDMDFSQDHPEDFLPDDLYTLKAVFLELEKVLIWTCLLLTTYTCYFHH